MNVFNPKPLTWCIYRFCTGVSNTGVNMIFKTFFFFFKIQGHTPEKKIPAGIWLENCIRRSYFLTLIQMLNSHWLKQRICFRKDGGFMFYITVLATGSSYAFQSQGELVRSQTGCWDSHDWAPLERFRFGFPETYIVPQNGDEQDNKLILHSWMPYVIWRFTELFVASALAVLFTASMRDQARFLYSFP